MIGVDINPAVITFAKRNLELNFPQLEGIVEFRLGEVSSLAGCEFDLMVSKNAFEHIIEPEQCLTEMASRLKPGGEIYIGFGPLYNSPFGHHGRIRTWPWGHLVVPQAWWLGRLARKYPTRRIQSLADLGLNGASLARFKRMIYESGLRVVYFAVNRGRNPLLKLFSLLRRLPRLEEYFSCNLYCILKRSDGVRPAQPAPSEETL